MKKEHAPRFGFFNPRILVGFVLGFGVCLGASVLAQNAPENSGIEFGQSYHNDVSPALRDLPTWKEGDEGEMHEPHEAALIPSCPS